MYLSIYIYILFFDFTSLVTKLSINGKYNYTINNKDAFPEN